MEIPCGDVELVATIGYLVHASSRRLTHVGIHFLPQVVIGLLLVLTGCSGKTILREQALIKDEALSVLQPKSTLQIKSGFPEEKKYHVGVRISEGFLNRAASELLEAEVVPSTLEKPMEVTIPPFGTRVVFRPGLTIEDPQLVFTGTCPECFRLSTRFTGNLALDVNASSKSPASRWFQGADFSGALTLKGRIIPMYTGGIASLGMQLQPLEENDLHLKTSIPLPGIDSLLTSTLLSEIREVLSNPYYNTFRLLPIKELGVPGSKLAVNGIAYALAPDPAGELRVGIDLSFATEPDVDLKTAGRALRGNDFAVIVGQNVLRDATRVWMAEDLVPAVYDTDGNPDPNGPLVVELRQLELFEDHYEISTRLWHIGSPPFWRDYRLRGVLAVRRDVVTIQNEEAEVVDKAGPNALVDLALKLEKTSLNKALAGIGSRLPRQIGFPFGSPAKLLAGVAVEEVQTDNHQVSIYGNVVFEKKKGEKESPGNPEADTTQDGGKQGEDSKPKAAPLPK